MEDLVETVRLSGKESYSFTLPAIAGAEKDLSVKEKITVTVVAEDRSYLISEALLTDPVKLNERTITMTPKETTLT